MSYELLATLIESFRSGPFSAIPEDLQQRIEDAFFPMPHWDELTPEQRLSVALQYDARNNPAMADERAYYWKLLEQIDEKQNEIAEMAATRMPVPTEIVAKRAALALYREELSSLEAQFGAPYPVPAAPKEPQVAAMGADGFDFALLASRQKLIDAFGKFTGMDATWFDNLNTSPRLKSARKVTGSGGRGRGKVPLFCPYQVMQWLVDRKRKKGRSLREEKAWQLLKAHFPAVYNQFSIGDPNTD